MEIEQLYSKIIDLQERVNALEEKIQEKQISEVNNKLKLYDVIESEDLRPEENGEIRLTTEADTINYASVRASSY